jgi:single-stranded-DNA-specific exonuclease
VTSASETGTPAGWPATAAAIEAARAFLRSCTGRVVIACDSDVDGLASAVIVERTVQAVGADAAVLPVRRGEQVHGAAMKERIGAANPARLIVLDMGSRPQSILPGLPTLIIDHHDARAGLPPGALVVNGYDRPPVAPTSVLAFTTCRPLHDLEGSAWLAALGAVADLGSSAAFAALIGLRASGDAWRRATALLNAARRASQPDPGLALDLLRQSGSVRDVLSGSLPGTQALERLREEVRRETDRCARVPPRVAGQVALVRFSSGAQVHPLVAVRWARRLRPRIVIAANDGYLPGRTNFAVRCDGDVDLVAWLRSLPFEPSPGAEFAHGHARATGGSLSSTDLDRFLQAAGVDREGPPRV